MNDFQLRIIIKAACNPYCVQLTVFEVTQTNPDGTPFDYLDFVAIKTYLIEWRKQLRTTLGDYAIASNLVEPAGGAV